ncbi:hypothetical protein [Candidatus Kryptobacter tengchongensis]|uniref:hypothetical protein n=1 Tax=Kryptobacter tengchongensis TaxID=1643429 RepID=UPI00092F57F6|nr:hypothetical protein [Candidatus Kryptobacter tengchongensis]
MSEPKYLSEYLEDFIVDEEQKQRSNGKINWKYLLILLLPLGTLILVAILLFKKFNSTKHRKNSIKMESS